MEIKCPACESGYRIPAEKLPPDKKAITFPCPNCSHPLTVQTNKNQDDFQAEMMPPSPDMTLADNDIEDNLSVSDAGEAENTGTDGLTFSYDASEKPFGFLDEGEQTALICESAPENRKTIRQSLETSGFHCSEADTTLAALKQMRYHQFDLVVLNETFDAEEPEKNPVRIYLSRLPMASRRNIFVVLINQRYRTMDNMAAFHLSVNQVVHEKNLDQLEKIIGGGLSDHKAFYTAYHQAEETVGEASDAILDRRF